MHSSAYAFGISALSLDEVAGKSVVEAGAYDVNGSVRPYIESLGPASYTGIDMRPGPRVDMVMGAADIPAKLGENCADIVASFEMLEHAEDWRAAVRGMILALNPGGLLIITTRSVGFPKHDHPGDFWRYSLSDMRQIATEADLDILKLENDWEAPGVFLKARKPEDWLIPALDWPDVTLAAIE